MRVIESWMRINQYLIKKFYGLAFGERNERKWGKKKRWKVQRSEVNCTLGWESHSALETASFGGKPASVFKEVKISLIWYNSAETNTKTSLLRNFVCFCKDQKTKECFTKLPSSSIVWVSTRRKESQPRDRRGTDKARAGRHKVCFQTVWARETQKHWVATGFLWKVKRRIVKIIQAFAVGKLAHSGRTRIGEWDKRNISLVVILLHMFTQHAKLGVKSIKNNWQPSTQSPRRLN